jgi:hypothetical protein
MQSILQPPTSSVETKVRLQLFLEEFFNLHLAQPEVARIILRECEAGFPMVFDIFKATFLKSFETLVEFVRTGQERGLIREQLDPAICSTAILSGVLDIVRKDPLNEAIYGRSLKDASYLQLVISNLLSIYLDGLSPRPNCENERNSE